MWKIWHTLFGWEYVEFTFGDERQVGRIKYSPGGLLVVNLYLHNYREVNYFYHRNLKAVTMTQEELDSWVQKEKK